MSTPIGVGFVVIAVWIASLAGPASFGFGLSLSRRLRTGPRLGASVALRF